ncbi:ATP synthase mitochondrial F1 complex assembly factor 2-like [Ipomoea triloba]|uniref:ATP synthase mitochondrial F1 complex assembly factor 2-like n=1 Tax=Ipomoea triloba TaxID=35885 RepID=UPI00125DEE62|nr:ATP synthase mitochondrial F1 complex assembly factor 2-like [Ipomoea triloba]
MATGILGRPLKTLNRFILRTLTASGSRNISGLATAGQPESDGQSSSFTFTSDNGDRNVQNTSSRDDSIYIKGPKKDSSSQLDASSVTIPMSFMTGSIVGKRFYKKVITREADDGIGWTVMLDYRTLKTPAKRPLKCPTHALAKAIAAEWEYQEVDGIRPFTMPLMQLACTAFERVPLTRPKIIENLMKKFNQDLVFCRAPGDNDLTAVVLERQVEKVDPLLHSLESEFGFKPAIYSSFFGGKQEDGLVNAIEDFLKKSNDCELAAIDAIAAAAHSLVIAIGVFRGRLGIEEAIELIRLEEDLQIDKWGLVEGGHDLDIADLQVQVASAAVFLRLSRTS